MIRKVNTII